MESQILSLDPDRKILKFWNEEEYKNPTLTQHEHLFPQVLFITRVCRWTPT